MTATDDVTLDLLAYLCELHRRLGEPQLRRGHNIVRLTTFYDDENFTVDRIHLDSGRLIITKKRRWPFRIVMSRHDERMIDEADRVALVRDIQALKMDPKPSGGGLDGTTWTLEIAAHEQIAVLTQWMPKRGPLLDIGAKMLALAGEPL